MLEKEKNHAFNKDVYLLGIDSDGTKYWLESPSWDCDWYWGFGYVETYQNNRQPNRARDIESHQHFNGFVGKQRDNKYIYHLNESPNFSETVLTEKESWELSDLMSRFYTFKESAGIFHRGSANLASNTRRNSKNEQMEEYINEVELPEIFKAVIDILSPK